jgi:hypothetical protein
MNNIPIKYHAKIRQMIKKAREDERKKINDIIATRSFAQKIANEMYQVIDIKELCQN